jgi:hypothetical protein
MPTVHIRNPGTAGVAALTTSLKRDVDEATAPTPLTLCGRRDIPRALTARDLESAQEKSAESSWTVCAGCTAAFGSAMSLPPTAK